MPGGPSSGKRPKLNALDSGVHQSDETVVRAHQALAIFQRRLRDVASLEVYEVALSVNCDISQK